MKTVLFLLGGFPVLLCVIGLLRPELMLGKEAVNASMIWTLLSAFASYLGFVFSFFAVVEVRNLSNRYFNKQRLPEIGKQLKKITMAMSDPGDTELIDIRTESYFSEMAVVLRQIRKTKVRDFSSIIDRAETHRTNIENAIRNSSSLSAPTNSSSEYWNLFGALSELADEIEAYQKGAEASL